VWNRDVGKIADAVDLCPMKDQKRICDALQPLADALNGLAMKEANMPVKKRKKTAKKKKGGKVRKAVAKVKETFEIVEVKKGNIKRRVGK
jgi:hypothetical protein